ncbi:MAG: hypothetical protein WA957_11615 [Alteraurantiacibacter sp.]
MIIRAILATSLALAASACVTPEAADTECAGEACVATGETFETGGAAITPLEVLEDSRCPSNAECIWEGRIRIRALVERDGRDVEVELEQAATTHALSGSLTLTQVWPQAPTAAGAISPAAYRFQFSWTPILLDAQL